MPADTQADVNTKEEAPEQKGGTWTANLKHSILVFALLFGFWVVMSGKTGIKYLLIGLFTCLAATLLSRPLLRLPSATSSETRYLAFELPYLRLIAYVPWILVQIIKANIEIALVIINPKMPIQPQVVYFRKPMEHPTAHTTLANSITLTPGTVTMDVSDGYYTVHALTNNAADGVLPEKGEGEIPAKVASVFGEKVVQQQVVAAKMTEVQQKG